MLCGQESNTKTTMLKLIFLKNHNKQMLFKCNFGPESKATYAESVGLSKLVLHTIAFQFCSLFASVLQF